MNNNRNPDAFLSKLRGVPKSCIEDLKEFEREKSAAGMAKGSRYIYLYSLAKLARFTQKPFRKTAKNDVIDFFKSIEDYKSPSIKISVKAFYKWLFKTKDYPECVDWIKPHGFERRKLPEEILTQEEVKQMAQATLNQRDRALIMLLYESGARAGELMGLKIKHVQLDEYGAVVMLNGKTGMRRIRLIDAVPDLKEWMNHHPLASTPEAPLFVELRSKEGRLGNHATLLHVLRSAKRRAGIKKRVYPHLFRHSRATHLAKEFTEQELKVIFGWSGTSRMPATYVHLSGGDIDRKMLEKRGLLPNGREKPDNALEARKCPKCEQSNPSTSRFCASCGLALDVKTAAKMEEKKREVDAVMQELINDPTIKQAILEKLAGRGLGKDLL
ncbi:Tyrosine recombinase XerA [Candidatus Gugararchaeum adminiculabundum]|nr:Tyrosine recombinase XerA [Candidatus Gugararchaeum adminiculabundum]